MTMNIILAIIAALCGLTVVGAGSVAAYKWFISGTDIRRSRNTAFVALALTALTGIGAIAPWLAAAPLGETTNTDNPGLNITLDDVEVSMSGFGSRAQVTAFLKYGFGDKYDDVILSCTDWELLAVDADGKDMDQAKIQANKAYLQAIGYKDDTGFRNGVVFPSTVITPDVYKNLSNMSADELEELYYQHRWMDVYRYTVTSLRYMDMVLQYLETYPEFNEQNSMWAPQLRETIDQAKADPDFLETLYVTEADGSRHLNAEMQYNGGMLCMSLDNAVITGIESPKSIQNWELPSLNPDPASRWTVRLDEPEEQEDYPSVIWAFPNTKSGQNAYKGGVNPADLRLEKFNPEEEPVKPATPTTPTTPPTDPGKPDTIPTNPTKRTITAHYLEDGTNDAIAPNTTHTFTVGKEFSVSPQKLAGWTYVRSSGTTSGSSMPDQNFDVYFYYKKDVDTSLVTLTVEHRDVDSGTVLKTDSYNVAKDSSQTLSAETFPDFPDYVYLKNSVSGQENKSVVDVTVKSNMTVTFFYYKEYMVTVRHLDWDTKDPVASEGYLYGRQGTSYTARALSNIPGYTYYRNSNGNSNTTITGNFPANNNTVVTFYYKKDAQKFTVTAIYKAIDGNHTLDTATQTVEAGKPYSTSQKSFAGYEFLYTTGDATSGTMPNRNVTVTYWYQLIKRDGDGKKDPDAGPGNNGTGNATEGIGPGKGEEDHYIPPVIHDTEDQEGDEPTANHRPTDNPGGQGAGSENRQEVGDETVSGVVPDTQDTPSSGTGGHDPGHVDTGATEVEGGGYTPPAKDPIVPDNPPSGSDPVIGAGQELAEP